MASSVNIIGGYQSDFSRNITREGLEIADLVHEVCLGTLEDAGIDVAEVQSIHVGNAFGQLYVGQGHLGAMPATVVDGLWGVPAMRHEAACASASMAVLAAMAEIESCRYDCVLVIGVEVERAVPGSEAAALQRSAAWVGHETDGVEFFWPFAFDRIAQEYDRRYGIDDRHLRALAELNRRNARSNPKAQTRGWGIAPEQFEADDDANPVVAGRLRRTDCCQITDGAAGVVLVSDRWLADHETIHSDARIAGWGHTTAGLSLQSKLDRSTDERFVMPHVRRAIVDAFGRAHIDGPSALDLIETHDCMTPSEYLAIDHFGITDPGRSWAAIEDGTIERDGRLPINPSGGLIGGGHPVGATGVRMLLDASRQVAGTAGECQIDGAARAATLNIGGSTATTACFVVEATDD